MTFHPSLISQVRQSGAVPDSIIMMAVAYQMDPASIDVSKFHRSHSH